MPPAWPMAIWTSSAVAGTSPGDAHGTIRLVPSSRRGSLSRGSRGRASPRSVGEAPDGNHGPHDHRRRGWRLRALIVVLWRARLRVQEALALSERDLDARRGSLLVRRETADGGAIYRHGRLGLGQLQPWLAARLELPVGPLFCVIDGPTCGRP